MWKSHRRKIAGAQGTYPRILVAVLPIENSFPTLKSNAFTLDNNDELLGKSLDLAEEKREKAMIHMACYHQKLKQGYDVNVRL